MRLVLMNLPTGTDGRDTVSINVEEIASARGHVVASYSYVDYTRVTLKNGTEHECRIKHSEFLSRLDALMAKADEGGA